MTAAAVMAPRGWAILDAADRRAGAAALAAAVEELVQQGADRHALTVAAGANAHRIVLGADGGWLLLVEAPRYQDRTKVPRVRNLEALDGDAEWCAAVDQPMTLADGLRALTDPSGGPAEVERRRRELEDRRRREAAERDARHRAERDALERVQRWDAEHAPQLEVWGKLPRTAQILLRAAHDHPASVGDALRAVARMTAQSERLPIAMPADFNAGVLDG